MKWLNMSAFFITGHAIHVRSLLLEHSHGWRTAEQDGHFLYRTCPDWALPYLRHAWRDIAVSSSRRSTVWWRLSGCNAQDPIIADSLQLPEVARTLVVARVTPTPTQQILDDKVVVVAMNHTGWRFQWSIHRIDTALPPPMPKIWVHHRLQTKLEKPF